MVQIRRCDFLSQIVVAGDFVSCLDIQQELNGMIRSVRSGDTDYRGKYLLMEIIYSIYCIHISIERCFYLIPR